MQTSCPAAGCFPKTSLSARARSLMAWQHSGLSGICPRLSFESSFYPDRREMTQEELGQAQRIFRVWESELQRSAGPFLLGALSLADLAFVPTVLRLTAHMKSLDQWTSMSAWVERLLARPAVKEWLDVARPLPVVRLDDYRA
jgi:glutathione S-transferase